MAVFFYNGKAAQVWSELPKGELPDDYCSSATIICSHVTTFVDDLGSFEYIEGLSYSWACQEVG